MMLTTRQKKFFDTEFETMLTQIDNEEVHVSEPPPCLASTTKCSSKHVYSFPKGAKAVENAMLLIVSHKKLESKPTGLLSSGVNGLGLEMLNFFLVRNHLAPICAACSCLISIFGFHGLY